MPKRISELSSTLRQIGEIQVNDWDFMALLNKDIKDLEIGRSLRKLGNTKVIDWDFKTALPAVHKFAHQEVDLVGLVKRAAHFKVMERDIRSALPHPGSLMPPGPPAPTTESPDEEEMQALIGRLKSFVEFMAVSLIDEADRARIKIQEIGPGEVLFELVVTQKDLTGLIGRNGYTASAIRNLLKAAAAAEGVHALLQIHSHEDPSAVHDGT